MPAPTVQTSSTTDGSSGNQSNENDINLPPPTVQEVLNCSFPQWYDDFRRVTFRSKIYTLPPAFITYLNADGIYLPDDGQPRAARSDDEADQDSTHEDTAEEEEEDKDAKPNFPEIEQFIRDCVNDMGNVFPKLNWSSPRDAAWISATQSLKCNSPFDVFLLLKSSDFINHDVNFAFEHCNTSAQDQLDRHAPNDNHFALILRKWHDLQPSMEFRVFVKNKEIIAISQRDLSYYDFLPDLKDELEDMIYAFFDDFVQPKFPSTNYVFDVYIERDRAKVWLVDFNPFTPTTDGLLFDWSELAELNDPNEPPFRILQSATEANAHATCAPRFAINMIPKDIVDLSDGRSVAEFAEEFERAMVLAEAQQQEESSEEEK